ncbi:MAG: hypothetical protein GX489_04795 [Firmicutes bacterium]|nr:hypothetical protein [Bacillota bacterium]
MSRSSDSIMSIKNRLQAYGDLFASALQAGKAFLRCTGLRWPRLQRVSEVNSYFFLVTLGGFVASSY